MKRAAAAGRGSNQYRRLPADPVLRTRSESADSAPNAEEVAWSFHPDRTAWQNAGFPTYQKAEPWIAAGVPVVDAAAWAKAGLSSWETAEPWMAVGILPETLDAGVLPGWLPKLPGTGITSGIGAPPKPNR